MDFAKSFTYMFKDKDWVKKIIMGGVFALLSVILVGIPFVLGYLLETIRNVAGGKDEELPAWDNLGDKFVDGLKLLAIMVILSIPLWLLSCVTWGFTALLANTNSDALVTLIGLVNILVSLLSFLYGVIYALFVPAFMIRYAMTKDFGQTLKFGEAWQVVKANLGNYILILLVAYLATMVASLGVIACVIGVFLTMFWAYMVEAHLLGQYQAKFVRGPAFRIG